MNWNLEKIYFNYLMGSYNSRYTLEEFNKPENRSYYEHPKNFEYWFGTDRFTYISRKHYKNDYVKGYLWGRYSIKNSLDNINDTDDSATDTEDIDAKAKSRTSEDEEERAF